ncbi:transient receptor potential cation channel subfamily V member 1-like [Hypomesus transpacificus]|uniref:transient receptor potential cation channel subfamily V member 1-like n=1 Tax=Hypomesus transpacificus TaxID=137520 RepID=UPI001F076C26|nr:transient receptor potential cation channel subfamily V member 1-like [Hypomesus transpacificus]
MHLNPTQDCLGKKKDIINDTEDTEDTEEDDVDNNGSKLLDVVGGDASHPPMDSPIPLPSRDKHNTLNMDRLFGAASKGDVCLLNGFLEYFQLTGKHLTDREFRDPTNGKTALLKALLNLKDGKNDTIETLLEIAEITGGSQGLKNFVNAPYTDIYYEGQTALHVAIERRSFHLVKRLVEKGADVQAKASGKFFQQYAKPGFYFGELPLSLAACTNQLDIVSYLMENPYSTADLTDRDCQGNTVLHALVAIADNTPENTDFVTRIYDGILIRDAKLGKERDSKTNDIIKLEDIENNHGMTPLKLAAKTGKIGIFRHMVQREFTEEETIDLSRKFTEWAYGPIHSSLYDLESLDTYESNSVLEIIVYGSGIPNRHEMLETEPLHRLLEEKWDMFASKMFFVNFIVYMVYLGIFTAVAFYRKEGQTPFPVEDTPLDYLRSVGEFISVIGAIYFLCKGIINLKRKPPNCQALSLDGFCDILFVLQAVLLLVCVLLYVCGQTEYVGPLVLSLAFSWINLLYFTRGSRHMGMYSVMMQRMIMGDIVRFLFVYIVFLLGFSIAIVVLNPPLRSLSRKVGLRSEICTRPTYNNIGFTTLELFKFTIGMGDLEFTDQVQYKEVFYILLISYIILTYILLLNMLIALMGETVEKISRDSESIWKLQRAHTILDLERSLPKCFRKKLRSGVVKKLGVAHRRFFRVEEVNWKKWRTNLGIINEEDPGSCEITKLHSHENTEQQGNQLRLSPLLRRFSFRQNQGQNRQGDITANV